jgi:hypothetical protein
MADHNSGQSSSNPDGRHNERKGVILHASPCGLTYPVNILRLKYPPKAMTSKHFKASMRLVTVLVYVFIAAWIFVEIIKATAK